MKSEPKPKIQLYKDRKYIIVKYDRSNFALLDARRFKLTNRANESLLGYYPDLKQTIMEVLRLRSEGQLLKQVRDSVPFKSLDTLVEEYITSVISTTLEVLPLVNQSRQSLVEVDIQS